MRPVSLFKAMIFGLMLISPASAFENAVFTAAPSQSKDFSYFPFWQQVLTDMAAAKPLAIPASLRSEAAAPCADQRHCIPAVWTTFLDSVRTASQLAQMNAVNTWANSRPYVEDQVNWGVPDYWETPGEFLARGGDCEDYAITKYMSLVRLGFSPDDLRIVIVKDTAAKAFHAVLAARIDGRVWLLDNQIPQAIPAEAAPHYVPVYSLNERGWWIHTLPKIDLGGITIAAGKAD